MKKFSVFILLVIILFIFPFSFSTLPDDWTLTAKEQLRNKVTKEDSSSSIKPVKLGNIGLHMTKSEIEKVLGKPRQALTNQFNSAWTLYDQSYRHFIMIGYQNNQVAAIYSNDPQYIEANSLHVSSTINEIKKSKGNPDVSEEGPDYKAKLNEDHILRYHHNGVITSYYYDQFEKKIDAIMLMSNSYFNQKRRFYGNPSVKLARSFEALDFALINAARVKRGLPELAYHDKLSHTAFKHSQDMADHHYFSHINLNRQSPFDRMAEDGIIYQRAAENIAVGQVSSIEAHHGLMNSVGHRKAILQPKYQKVGVGVAFNENNMPYYTENFIAEN